MVVGGAGLPAHPSPATLTSKGSTSTDVLKSLSSGCSMFPLRKKNLRPDRPVSCCHGEGGVGEGERWWCSPGPHLAQKRPGLAQEGGR